MAFALGTSYVDSAHYKIFDITVLENDAANLSTAFLFATPNWVDLAAAPEVYWTQEVTAGAANPTQEVAISLEGMTTTGFTVNKVSALLGGAVTHTFRVYIFTKRAFEV